MDFDRLQLRPGEAPTARHMEQLDSAIAAQTPQRAAHVLIRQTPWGFSTSRRGQGGGAATSDTFAPTVRRVAGGFAIKWSKGTIEGLEPTIGGVPGRSTGTKISFGTEYLVTADKFNSLGESNVYFRTTYNASWFPTVCTPFASAEEPGLAPWQSDKLALVLYRDGSFWRGLYSNQGHLALNRRATTGFAQHIYWGKM